ncbi:MAG TPA: peptide chain release factor N(5)-glutamine methyltransferase [Rhodanobacteraceae bacterium]|nr:peptide chain release factor N(5)-glutamine methyltransferase [Rhodanobacteraceae bacterium]
MKVSHALAGAGIEPREARLLLAEACGFSEASVIAQGGRELPPEIEARFNDFVARRRAGEPIAYIVGRREFWSLDLTVNPDVLIPRPETELLVELALQRIPQNAQVDIADLGTGSGAIALAIACERPRARVLATDASTAALAVARDNATRLGIGNVGFAQGDWCAAVGGQRFDLLVSNPPYIAQADIHLQQGDLRFEPRAALASGIDGLDAIRSIVAAAPGHLHPHGWLLFEHGHDQGSSARDLLAQSGFVETFTAVDLEQRDRVSGGRARA